MIVYGHRYAKINQEPEQLSYLEGGQLRTFDADVFAHYVHIYWIPLFPTKKVVGYMQDKKIVTYSEQKVSDHVLRESIMAAKVNHPYPAYTFVGLALIAIGGIVALFLT